MKHFAVLLCILTVFSVMCLVHRNVFRMNVVAHRHFTDSLNILKDKNLSYVFTHANGLQPRYIRKGQECMLLLYRACGNAYKSHYVFRFAYIGIWAALLFALSVKYNAGFTTTAFVVLYIATSWHLFSLLYIYSYADYYGVPILAFILTLLHRNKWIDILMILLSLVWIETGVIAVTGMIILRREEVYCKQLLALSIIFTGAWLVYRQILITLPATPYQYYINRGDLAWNIFSGLVYTFTGIKQNVIPSLYAAETKYFLWVTGSFAMKLIVLWLFIKKCRATKLNEAIVAMAILGSFMHIWGKDMCTWTAQVAMPVSLLINNNAKQLR